jgi:hypothetical protein
MSWCKGESLEVWIWYVMCNLRLRWMLSMVADALSEERDIRVASSFWE